MKRLLFLGIFCQLALISQAQTNANAAVKIEEKIQNSGIAFEQMNHDFGTIPQGKPAKVTFTFKNTSAKPLVLTQVQSSCGCTASDYSQELIYPGKTGYVTATYNAANAGPFTKTVTVITSLGGEPVLLNIRGTVNP